MKVFNAVLLLALAATCINAADIRAPVKMPEQKIVPLEDDAAEAVNVATDTAIKSAKKSTKKAIEKMARGVAPTSDSNDQEEKEQTEMVQSLTGDTSVMGGGPKAAGNSGSQSTGGTGSTGSTGNTGGTGNTGASGATGSGRLWFFAPACNGRGSLHTVLNKCICHKKHSGNKCEFKKLRTGEWNHQLQKVESHGRYVGVSKCLNGTPMGENDCVCFPGFSGYHCDQRECRNGKMVCANGVKFCQKSTVCRCDPGWSGDSCDRPFQAPTGVTGNTGGTGISGGTGGTGATGSASTGPSIDGPSAMKKIKTISVKYQRPKPRPAFKQSATEMKESIANDIIDRLPVKRL